MDEQQRPNRPVAEFSGTAGKEKPLIDNVSTVSNTPRKRVSKACDRCRSRKDRCDGQKPRCSTCAALDQICSYDPATKKRGLPEGYVRGLEKLWGLTIRKAEGIQDTILGILGNEASSESENIANTWNDREGKESLQETWRKSRIAQELDRLLPILDSMEDKLGKRKRSDIFSTPTSDKNEISEPPIIRLPRSNVAFSVQNLDSGQHNSNITVSSEIAPQRHLIDTTTTGNVHLNPDSVDLPQRAWHLLDVYFSYTHCWLPIIEKHELLRTSYQYPVKLAISCSVPGSGIHAALWAALAFAEHQNSVIKYDSQSSALEDEWTVDCLYSHARGLIPSENGVFEVGHIQALLILTLVNMGHDHWDRAWLLVGQAVRLSFILGLDHVIIQSNAAGNDTRRSHVFLGCFILDTIVASHLGRTPQLRKEDLDRIGSVEEDGGDEWNPWVDTLRVHRHPSDGHRGPVAILSTFNRLVQLVKILNSISRDVSIGPRRAEVCHGLLNDLSSWGQVLPSQFSPTAPSGVSRDPILLPHQFNLHISHLGIISVLYSHLSTCTKAMHISDQTLSQTYATVARQTMWLLMRQSESFSLLIVPPTFDYFVSVAIESSYRAGDNLTDYQITESAWEQNMQHYLDVMSKAWPTFEDRRQSFLSKRIDSSVQKPFTPASLSTEGSPYNSYLGQPLRTKQPAPTSSKSNIHTGQLPINDTNPSPNRPTSPAAQYDSLSNSTTAATAYSIPNVTTKWASQIQGTNSLYGPPSKDHGSFAHDRSLNSDMDSDSMFNEFATLDAMEWTNNWDQSLLNLGFTDTKNMHSDFYAFAREPDPLYSMNLVQQLLANQDSALATGSDLLMRSSGPDIGVGDGLGIGGQYGGQSSVLGRLSNEAVSLNPHVEASQILQALSATHDGHVEGRVRHASP